MKKIILSLSLLFLLFPLFFFATHGTLIGEVCCQFSPFSLYVVYQQFAPTSLIIGLFFLAIFFIKPIKNLKKFKDYFLLIISFPCLDNIGEIKKSLK